MRNQEAVGFTAGLANTTEGHVVWCVLNDDFVDSDTPRTSVVHDFI
jgi:hypothetical protein